jgi:nitrite reductase/ring-hydroxylating ferredoxin subunit
MSACRSTPRPTGSWTRGGKAIVCSAHGARFRIEDGLCTSGPCHGESLEAVPVRLDEEGRVVVAADAGL